MNIGGSEFLVISLLALFLFGPSLLAFWFGYVLGQKKGEEAEDSSPGSTSQTPAQQPSAAEPPSEGPPSAEAPAVVGNGGGNEAE
jgi:Sec-independent protein translocase protein TatA